MNRHERRAAQSKQQSKVDADSPFINIDIGAFHDAPASGTAAPMQTAGPAKPTLTVRLLSKILLSRWVLARVQHPDVERLLMGFATETGRQDVVDELIRRQAMLSGPH
jgi:hypothetical protein